MNLADAIRFWSKVDRRGPDECWPWTEALTEKGYGRFWIGQHGPRAHRVAYELLIGPIPDGLQLDHVRERGCTTRACVNPAHLEPVTPGENTRRGTAGQNNRAKTHCPKNHPYDEANTHRRRRRGHRACRACDRERKAQQAREAA